MKLSRFLAPFVLTSLLTVPALAGERGGNGGDGIYVNGKLYVLDLVEAGAENLPLTGRPVSPRQAIISRLTYKLGTDYPVQALATKLTELETVEPVLARVILRGIEIYDWRIVSAGLVNVTDENSLIQDQALQQIAIRRNSRITITRAPWEQLDETNKVALIFHEILYALVKPVNGEQDSVTARELVGHLFGETFLRGGVPGLAHVMRQKFSYVPVSLPFKRVRELTNPDAHESFIWFNPRVLVYANIEQPRVESFLVMDRAFSYGNSFTFTARVACESTEGARIELLEQTLVVKLAQDESSTYLTTVPGEVRNYGYLTNPESRTSCAEQVRSYVELRMEDAKNSYGSDAE